METNSGVATIEPVADAVSAETSAETAEKTGQLTIGDSLLGAPDEKTSTEAAVADPDSDTGVYTLKMPDDMPLDTALLERFTPLLKGLKADDAAAQRLADAFVEHQREQASATTSALEAQRVGWFKEVQKHETLGGKNFETTQTNVRRALNSEFVPKELREAFLAGDGKDRPQGALYFLQTYPPLVQFFANIGAQLGEAGFTSTNKNNGAKDLMDKAREMFSNSPDMFKNT